MKTIESVLRMEMGQLEKIAEEARKRLKMAPKGHLRIRRWNGVVEYYYREAVVNSGNVNSDNNANSDSNANSGSVGEYGVDSGKKDASNGNSNGRYLKKSEKSLAEAIAQRDYDEYVVKNAEERVKVINTFLKKYEKTSLKKLYQKMKPCRRELISPSLISDEEYISKWQAVEYVGKSFADDSQEIITERGERVRSKSEKIIADKLYALGIPYRYEYPLFLEGNIKIYPDFTILRMPAREEVYLEHLGLMDDGNYVENVMYKLNTYERSGIYLGVKLFITHETKKSPLNTRALDGLIRNLFCEE